MPTKKKAESKSAVKKAQSSQAEKQAESRKKAADGAAERKEALAADLPVARSGLSSVSQDDLNPAFKLDTE